MKRQLRNLDQLQANADKATALFRRIQAGEGDEIEQVQQIGELWKEHSDYDHLMHFMADHVGFDSAPRRVAGMLTNCISGWAAQHA